MVLMYQVVLLKHIITTEDRQEYIPGLIRKAMFGQSNNDLTRRK